MQAKMLALTQAHAMVLIRPKQRSWNKSGNKAKIVNLASVTNCRSISKVECWGLQRFTYVASGDPSCKPPSVGTILTIIHGLCDIEKAMRVKQLAQTTFITLT